MAIPRKGSVRLQLFVEMTELQVANIEPFSTSALAAVPPQRRYPDRPPLMVKGVLVVVKIIRTKTFYNSAHNEICLTANEILLRKKKSDKSDEISLGEVAVVGLKMQYDIRA